MERRWRLEHALQHTDTNKFWDLLTAAVETANIEFHDLTNTDATNMKGRSKVTLQTREDKLPGLNSKEEETEATALIQKCKKKGCCELPARE